MNPVSSDLEKNRVRNFRSEVELNEQENCIQQNENINKKTKSKLFV